jgi:hypothetical protein
MLGTRRSVWVALVHILLFGLSASSVPIGGIRWIHGPLVFVPRVFFTGLMTHYLLILIAFCGYGDIGRIEWVGLMVLNNGTKKEVDRLFIITIGLSHYLVFSSENWILSFDSWSYISIPLPITHVSIKLLDYRARRAYDLQFHKIDSPKTKPRAKLSSKPGYF